VAAAKEQCIGEQRSAALSDCKASILQQVVARATKRTLLVPAFINYRRKDTVHKHIESGCGISIVQEARAAGNAAFTPFKLDGIAADNQGIVRRCPDVHRCATGVPPRIHARMHV